jgi:hypothetical protein
MFLKGILKFFVLFISLKVVFIKVERDTDVNFGDSEFAELIGDIDFRGIFLFKVNVKVLLFDNGSNVSEVGAEL